MPSKMLDMPKKRSEEKTATIRVSESIAKMIDIIGVAEGLTSSKIASPLLEKAIKARYLKALETLNRGPKDFGLEE